MISLISNVQAFVATLPSFAPVYIDQLSADAQSIAVRADPGQSNEQRDLTGARFGDFVFSIYCKSPDAQESIEQLEAYISLLDLADFALDDRTRITCEPITQPHFVSKADNGEAIYTASFHINYFQGV